MSTAMNNRIPMTKNGEAKLRAELMRLKNEARPRVISAIAAARELGDLKENAEYHAAREEQSFIEGKIREIEHKLSHAQVIDSSTMTNNGKVIFSSTVELINIETDVTVVYQIVGDDEADIKEGKISVNSPLARGIIGKNCGDEVTIHTPRGDEGYLINKVDYL